MAGSPGRLVGLAAGLLLLDILLNLPLLSTDRVVGSLLAPSIDLLVLAAVCMVGAQAGAGSARARIVPRIIVAVVACGLFAAEAGLRLGWDAGARLLGAGAAASAGAGGAAAGWVLSALILAGAGVAAFFLSGLVITGMETPMVRSIVLLAIALAAVLQVVSGRKLFSPSVIPKLLSLIA